MGKPKKATAKKAAAPKPPKPAPVAGPDAEAAPYLHRPAVTEAAPWLDSNPTAAAAMTEAAAGAED
jgi:hypothetical protein